MNTAVSFSENKEAATMNNSLGQFTSTLTNPGGSPVQLSRQDTLQVNTSWAMISNNRTLLSQAYVQHGIIQTLVDQPVDDAFRPGFDIKSKHLTGDDVEELINFMEKHGVIRSIVAGNKWARLYGGGGVLLITEDDPRTPLNIETLKQGDRIAFKAFDMWELYYSLLDEQGEATLEEGKTLDEYNGEFYDYYGHQIHRSRVMRINGKEAPAFVRPRLRGWGMSEVERCLRSLNQYLKNQDVIFELLDEAKVDVYKMKGFNSALMNSAGTTQVATRVQHANMIKNFQNAIVMDSTDEYDQKAMSFGGLAEILTQIRQGVAADLKMPLTKLFGISASGFNSGEDDIENYNSMVESEVRAKTKFHVVEQVKICCQVLFGFIPDDVMVIFKPLRILGADAEEKVKTEQFNRTSSAFSSGLITAQEAKAAINKGSLLPVEVDEKTDALPPLERDFTAGGGE